jgi:hypothetical protein
MSVKYLIKPVFSIGKRFIHIPNNNLTIPIAQYIDKRIDDKFTSMEILIKGISSDIEKLNRNIDEKLSVNRNEMNMRMDNFENNMNQKFSSFEGNMNQKFTHFEGNMNSKFTHFESSLNSVMMAKAMTVATAIVFIGGGLFSFISTLGVKVLPPKIYIDDNKSAEVKK